MHLQRKLGFKLGIVFSPTRLSMSTKSVNSDVYLDVELTSGYTAKVRMRVPEVVGFSHPLIVDVYGGPESQVS